MKKSKIVFKLILINMLFCGSGFFFLNERTISDILQGSLIGLCSSMLYLLLNWKKIS